MFRPRFSSVFRFCFYRTSLRFRCGFGAASVPPASLACFWVEFTQLIVNSNSNSYFKAELLRPEVSLNPLARGGIYFSFSAYSCIHGSIVRQQVAGPVSQPLALGLLPIRSVRFGLFSGGRGGSYSDSIRFVTGEGYSLRIRFILNS